MSGIGKRPRFSGHWSCWVVMVTIETGSGMDYDTYNEEFSGVEWRSKKNALIELKEALATGHKAFLECRDGDTIMNVTLIWDDGTMTRIQSVNALKIAQKWLYTYINLLAVFCTTTQTLYLKED